MRNVWLCLIAAVALIAASRQCNDEPVTRATDEIISSGDRSDELGPSKLDEYHSFWQQTTGAGIVDDDGELPPVEEPPVTVTTTGPPDAPFEPSVTTTESSVTTIEPPITTTAESPDTGDNDDGPSDELLQDTVTPVGQSGAGTIDDDDDDDDDFKESRVEPFDPSVTPIDQTTCPSCSCGALGKHKRIVGGTPTYKHQYPWMAMITYRGKYNCGGSLINNKYVLTAAHCVNNFEWEDLRVRLLEYDRFDDHETKHIDLNVTSVNIYYKYKPATHNNDIALLRLDTDGLKLGQDTGIDPVCLPDEGKTFAGYEGIVTGWGTTKQGGTTSRVLREVAVQIMSNEDCLKTNYKERIRPNMMCAGYMEGKKDSCQGDSGSPLHINVDSMYQIVGLVSWGEGCAKPNYPGVYARVNKFLKWIARHTADACLCTKRSNNTLPLKDVAEIEQRKVN